MAFPMLFCMEKVPSLQETFLGIRLLDDKSTAPETIAKEKNFASLSDKPEYIKWS